MNTPGSPSTQPVRRTPALIYRWLGDSIFSGVVTLLGLTIIVLAVALAWFLASDAAEPIRKFGFIGFFTGSTWDPVNGIYGAWPFFLGTAITSVAALLLSFFPALAVAIFTAEYAPRWLSGPVDYLIDLLAAVPSVVIGIWGIFVFAPTLREHAYGPVHAWATLKTPGLAAWLGTPTGFGLVTATLVLALMVVPYTTALARDAIRLVPHDQREAAWALGATKWEVIRLAVLPFARGGISTGAILSFGRALGETMAVAMLIGNSSNLPFQLFGPAATMPSVIINEFREAVDNLQVLSLIGIGFYLFLISLLVNLFAAWVQRKLAVASHGA